ncbi:DUF2177 family protein [Salinimonas marina]|uniref:DUF2177 family protein n=1 Tax=Salinimonas marina TaxID=2785918 RepID=A0A7S9DX67_9ALTE|nr:DUF2177 family protein [Salinimonas marina]QPG05622.1 DUF2177 family protein [Salinimonas marina]
MTTKTSTFGATYLSVLIAFGILDGLWLGVVARPRYMEAFAGLLRDPFITWPWLTFYLLYGLAVVMLAVRPARYRPVGAAAANGFILGATAYGTYNLTAYSIIAGWPLGMSIVDWVWGAFVTTILAAVGAWTAKRKQPPA